MYMEDLDLCYQFDKAGWVTWYEPSATVVHVKAGTTGAVRSPRLNYAFHYGMFRFYRKHYAAQRARAVNALRLFRNRREGDHLDPPKRRQTPREWLSAAPGRSHLTTRPKVLYIAGPSRSGSTMLDLLLGELDGYVATGELRNLWGYGLLDGWLCGCREPMKSCPFWRSVLERAGLDRCRPRLGRRDPAAARARAPSPPGADLAVSPLRCPPAPAPCLLQNS